MGMCKQTGRNHAYDWQVSAVVTSFYSFPTSHCQTLLNFTNSAETSSRFMDATRAAEVCLSDARYCSLTQTL